MKNASILRIAGAVLVLAVYPAFVLGYTWAHVARSPLPGGRQGPLDAYRHTLASAVVAYTLGPRVVDAVTLVMEHGETEAHRMDRHNNRIGADTSVRALSFGDIEPTVRAQVQRGAVNATKASQTTWLPPERWRPGGLW